MSYATEQWPRPHRFTVEESCRIAEIGLLSPDVRVELVEGLLFDMGPPGPAHESHVDVLSEQCVLTTYGRAITRTHGPVQLSGNTLLRPDIALLKFREDGYAERHPGGPDILLIIEVADSTIEYDFGGKLALYARHGVQEVWILDMRTYTLHFFRSRTDVGYGDQSSTRNLGIVPLPSLGLTVDLSGLVRA
jgi:Uma2 family endonuclease